MKHRERKMKEKTESRLKSFFFDLLKGMAIGVAFIIPGFSGGSIAAILGIYEKLVGAIADIFKSFKKSIATLLPIGLGMVIGVLILLFPLSWALGKYPLPTVCLFVGLAIGGMPSITEKIPGKPSVKNLLALLIPLVLAASLSFLPIGQEVDLLNLDFGGHVLLFFIGALGSTALVVPGISGSMILLILGYYNPLVNLITHNLIMGNEFWASLLVLLCTAAGIGIGFFAVSVAMKILLTKCPRGTYFAILGFIVGSIPAIYASTMADAGITLSTLPTSFWHWAACAALLLAGIAISLFMVKKSKTLKN